MSQQWGSYGFQPQPTGFYPQQQQQQQQRPPMPPAPSFLSQPPPPPAPSQRFGPSPLLPQATGYVPGMGMGGGMGMRPLVAQPTGFVDPRLSMLSSSFLPANTTAPYASVATGGSLQFNAPQLGGISAFQQAQPLQPMKTGMAPPQQKQLGWALTKAEKKQYDNIFRGWDSTGSGFISGETALPVFGQRGLERNDLARIW